MVTLALGCCLLPSFLPPFKCSKHSFLQVSLSGCTPPPLPAPSTTSGCWTNKFGLLVEEGVPVLLRTQLLRAECSTPWKSGLLSCLGEWLQELVRSNMGLLSGVQTPPAPHSSLVYVSLTPCSLHNIPYFRGPHSGLLPPCPLGLRPWSMPTTLYCSVNSPPSQLQPGLDILSPGEAAAPSSRGSHLYPFPLELGPNSRILQGWL